MNMNKKQFIDGCQGVLSSNAFSTEISYLECHAIKMSYIFFVFHEDFKEF